MEQPLLRTGVASLQSRGTEEFSINGGLQARKSSQDGQEELPYSVPNELRYFVNKSIPLGLSAILEWGVPPLMNMVMAGQTADSSSLQTALGYGRVFYNCTLLLFAVSFEGGYIGNVPPFHLSYTGFSL